MIVKAKKTYFSEVIIIDFLTLDFKLLGLVRNGYKFSGLTLS
jgi:hypothetical protein